MIFVLFCFILLCLSFLFCFVLFRLFHFTEKKKKKNRVKKAKTRTLVAQCKKSLEIEKGDGRDKQSIANASKFLFSVNLQSKVPDEKR